jgi:hypothetical protein
MSLMSVVSSQANTPARVSSTPFCSAARVASRLLRSYLWDVRALSSCLSSRSSYSSLSHSFNSWSATSCSD